MKASHFSALRRFLSLVARPAKQDRGRGGIIVQPYRGYGSRKEVLLMGRVFRQPNWKALTPRNQFYADLLDIFRRMIRSGVSDAVLSVRLDGTEQRVRADADGYFKAHLRLKNQLAADCLWQPVNIELVRPSAAAPNVQGNVFIPPRNSRYMVISDIDDTVIYTGVANKIKMLWRLFVQGYRSRSAFPGIAAFYRALHYGHNHAECNPILYVSRGPWSIYEVLEQFFKHHGIPVGPILFLREWGLTLKRPFPRRSKDHKLSLIREMLRLYAPLPVLLIGDSGQRDPEIYTRIVRENPGRIQAIYIRSVDRRPDRIAAVQSLAAQVLESGSTLVLSVDSYAMARHAVEHGFISRNDLDRVLAERVSEGTRPIVPDSVTIDREN